MSHVHRSQISVCHELPNIQHIVDQKVATQHTNSMSLFSRNTPYSYRYVSTPFEYSGNLRRKTQHQYRIHSSAPTTHILGPTMAEIPSLIKLLLPIQVTG